MGNNISLAITKLAAAALRSGTYFIPTDFIQKLISEVGDGSNTAEEERSQGSNLYPLLIQHNGGGDSWNKGENMTNIVQMFVDKSHVVNIIIYFAFYFLKGLRIQHNKISMGTW